MQVKLADIAERHAKATPGEWETWPTSAGSGHGFEIGPDQFYAVAACYPDTEIAEDCAVNADFMAHAHQDIPFLLDLAKTQAAEIARLTAALAEAEERGRVKGIEEAIKYHKAQENHATAGCWADDARTAHDCNVRLRAHEHALEHLRTLAEKEPK